MEVYKVDSTVHGHHVFKEIGHPLLEIYKYAVGIMRQEESRSTDIVGHELVLLHFLKYNNQLLLSPPLCSCCN